MGKKPSSSKKLKKVHQEIDSAFEDDDLLMDNEEQDTQLLLNHVSPKLYFLFLFNLILCFHSKDSIFILFLCDD